MLPKLTLVLGGARSGKSRHAETLVTAHQGPWRYVARHRARRATGWITVDAPLELPETLSRIGGVPAPILVDCLTLWVTNLLMAERDVDAAGHALRAAIAEAVAPVVLVSNEVGLGIVPDNALARRFRDEAGALHQSLAAAANSVLFMVAGLPMTVK